MEVVSWSMVICDLYFGWTLLCPIEAHSILVVDSDAVLTGPISFQFFKPISWRYSKVIQNIYLIQLVKLSEGYLPKRRGTDFACLFSTLTVEYILGSLIGE